VKAPPHDAWPEALARLVAQRTGLSRIQLGRDQLQQVARLPQPSSGEESSAEWEALIDAITVRETYFFRHAEHFEALRVHVLPELRACRLLEGGLRAWSAGCASGEEPYSLTMLLAEEGLLERAHVLGTDLSRAAIERARAGVYRDWSLRALSPERQYLHFESKGSLHAVRNHLKVHVSLRQLNLAEDCYPSPITQTCELGLIFCRNVLMFLNPSTTAAIAERLFRALAPGGYLFTGPSDPNLTAHAGFELHMLPGACVYRRPLALRLWALPQPEPLPDSRPADLPLTAADHRPLLSSRPPAPPSTDTEEPDITRGIRETWNESGAEAALQQCLHALEKPGLEQELHYLRGLLLWELQQYDEALRAMRRVLYLDRGHALAHFGLGSIQETLGDLRAAQRCYRNTLATCAKLAPDAALQHGDGLSAEGLSRAAEHGLRRLAAQGGSV
jgi:chemotaxis protein methyltransferase CheR